MLHIIDKYKAGILGTIILHLVLITIILIMKINALKQKEVVMPIDMLSEEQVKELLEQPKPEEKKPEISRQEFLQNMQQEYLGARNIANNVADKDAADKIKEMEQQIKNELGVKDPGPSNASSSNPADERPNAESLPQKIEQPLKVTSTVSPTGVRTFYKGPTTVSYFLEGRYHVYLKIPVYECQGSGKVVMKIEVNRQGYVTNIEINRAESVITEDCVLESAERAIRSTRFNEKADAPLKQTGNVTYIFVAQ